MAEVIDLSAETEFDKKQKTIDAMREAISERSCPVNKDQYDLHMMLYSHWLDNRVYFESRKLNDINYDKLFFYLASLIYYSCGNCEKCKFGAIQDIIKYNHAVTEFHRLNLKIKKDELKANRLSLK